MMTYEERVELTREQIAVAVHDYWAHVNNAWLDESEDIYESISNPFIERLACDSVAAKSSLRELLSKSPAWNEELDALVINGTRTHNPDPNLMEAYIRDLKYLISDWHARVHFQITAYLICDMAVDNKGFDPKFAANRKCWFYIKNAEGKYSEKEMPVLNYLQTYIPKAAAAGKKLTRCLMELCKAFGIADESRGSEFQKIYAQLADEMTSRKLGYKLFVSINPAHFLTMSNPKGDERGDTLTSCHSLNCTEYDYNNGCTGYARDDVTMIAFTVADPSDSESLNNRKTTRQLYMYKPYNGVLLQSRMYDTYGGTEGAQELSDVYRDLIQREICEAEGTVNRWITKASVGTNFSSLVEPDYQFGGYSDWRYSNFGAKIAVQREKIDANGSVLAERFSVGRYGLCLECGEEIRAGLLCSTCKDEHECAYCGCTFHSGDMRIAMLDGEEVLVCEDCFDMEFEHCEICGTPHLREDMAYVEDCGNVCRDCVSDCCVTCESCGNWICSEDALTAETCDGAALTLCSSCYDTNVEYCAECGEDIFKTEAQVLVHDCEETHSLCGHCPRCNANQETEATA